MNYLFLSFHLCTPTGTVGSSYCVWAVGAARISTVESVLHIRKLTHSLEPVRIL